MGRLDVREMYRDEDYPQTQQEGVVPSREERWGIPMATQTEATINSVPPFPRPPEDRPGPRK